MRSTDDMLSEENIITISIHLPGHGLEDDGYDIAQYQIELACTSKEFAARLRKCAEWLESHESEIKGFTIDME